MQNRSYLDAITEAGAVTLPIPPMPVENARVVYEFCDAVCLAGGRDIDPARYGKAPLTEAERRCQPELEDLEIALTRWAHADRKPLLGICRGAQIISVAFGGTLWQDIPHQLGAAGHAGPAAVHEIVLRPGRLRSILGTGELKVNSRHHQAVRDPGAGLRPAAYATDGVVEAVESDDDWFAIGVQWHPEEMSGDAHSADLFASLVDAARRADR